MLLFSIAFSCALHRAAAISEEASLPVGIVLFFALALRSLAFQDLCYLDLYGLREQFLLHLFCCLRDFFESILLMTELSFLVSLPQIYIALRVSELQS